MLEYFVNIFEKFSTLKMYLSTAGLLHFVLLQST